MVLIMFLLFKSRNVSLKLSSYSLSVKKMLNELVQKKKSKMAEILTLIVLKAITSVVENLPV